MPYNSTERAAKHHALIKDKYPDRTRRNYNATPVEHEKLKLMLDNLRK